MARKDEMPKRPMRSSDIDGRVSGSRNNRTQQGRNVQQAQRAASQRPRQQVQSQNMRPKQKKKKKRHIFRNFVILLLLVTGAVVAFLYSKLGKMHHVDLGTLQKNDLTAESKKVMQGYTNVALFGVDNRSNGNFDSGNSDTIIIASIDNASNDIKMVSLYRDSYLNIGEDEFTKCNAAYQKGGPKAALDMINTNLDLDINYYVAVDWNALVETIDLLGGIDIELTAEEAHLTEGYIDEIAGQTGVSSEYPGEGMQHLNGVQATAYARIRYTKGWDFKRTERQRLVLGKILEKAKSAGPVTLNNVIDKVLPDISTNLTSTKMLSLATGIASYNIADTTGFPFEKHSTGKELNYIVIPINLDNNVRELHQYLYGEENFQVSGQVQANSDRIIQKLGQFNAD